MKKKKKLKIKKTVKKKFIFLVFVILAIIFSCEGINYLYTIERKILPQINEKQYYNLSDFGFAFKPANNDYNQNKIDDYQDILNGARKVAKQKPKYISKYYDGGYPPRNEGISTDLIAWSLKEAGYDLKELISKDIKQTQKSKKNIYDIEIRDDNIDFRRIDNQKIFFDRYAKSLTNDIYEIGEFQPGDIIIFDYSSHIAVISDKINKNGVPYIIHLYDDGQKEKEEDVLEKINMEITNHYRFEYSEKLEHLIES